MRTHLPISLTTRIKALGLAALLTGSLAGCLTPEELAALNASLNGESHGSTAAPDVGPACVNERYIQADAEISRSIDLLFVMDTSGSMSDNRAKVADGISAFVAELPSNVDYQVGVMLAHGSTSTWSGKLFRYNNVSVFSSKTMSVNTIQTQLRSMVLHVPTDAMGEQGEEGTYSFLKGITTHLATNRAAGFFRTNAALAVVFVSDENDICAPTSSPATMPGMTSAERSLRSRDCSAGIATNAIISQVRTLQGTRPYLFGAVVHQTLGYHDSSGNDGYGYGYMDIVQANYGVSTEINDGSYTQGLSNMGKLATIKLNLLVDFTLARTNIDPATIRTQVDGADMTFTYDAVANEVHLTSGGGARSTIDINYCLKAPVNPSSGSGSGDGSGPTPSPSNTPAPTWTPPPAS